MTDIGNNTPVIVHDDTFVDTEATARLFWLQGLKKYNGAESESERTADWNYIVFLSQTIDVERRIYWFNSVDPAEYSNALATFLESDLVYQRLEIMLDEAKARVPKASFDRRLRKL